MKRTEGKMLNPKTAFGALYWKALSGGSAHTCYTSRMWIVPGDVEVRQDGSSLYILKAKLNVKAKAEKINGLGQESCNDDPAATARNEQLEQQMVVPKMVKIVNTSPEYAPLRRAFLARVVAQWILDRHQGGHSTSFDSLIGSGDLGSAKVKGSWRPRQVYDAYVQSIKNGDFTYTQTVHTGGKVIVYKMETGGVDFSRLNSAKISAAQMAQSYPGLQNAVQKSISHPTSAPDGSLWLGEAAGSPHISTLSRITKYVSGRTGMLVVLVVALGLLLLFVRDGSALRRRTPR
ncbi:hypothetical protein ACL07V_34860 [Streptomyces sp. MB22_4]|uniref:hypothetical protein n=1 Tax=Streptomyces sp. MB22_4 TaxID=3383120 RepID=UPI00399F4424